MEKEEKKINEEEKQNAEEEEFDEEEEEEKEDNEKKKEKKDINEDNKKESNEQGKVDKDKDKDKDKEIEGQQIEQTVEEKDLKSNEKKEKEEKDEKEQNSVKKEEISTKTEEKIENINKNEKEILETENKQNEIKDNANTNNNEVKNEIKNENEENNDDKNNKIEKIEEENEKEEKDEELKDTISTYILKYTRKNNEPRESSYDKELINCLFMIEFKILQGKKEKFLLIYCHEIAAIYFDEIYEKKYSLNDLYKENRHFRIFDDIEEAKKVIDEILNNNNSNSKKIFIDLKDNIFRLHLNITFFDKENEVIFSIPKKHINDKERIRLLPEFLKEIQIKMNHLEEDNKRLKNENKNMTEGDNLNSGGKVNINKDGENDFLGTKNEVSPNIKKIKSGNMKGYKKKLIKK